MLSRHEANTILDHLARDSGMATLELNEQDTLVLAFGDTHELIIEFVAQDGVFVLWCAVGTLEDAGADAEQLEFARYLLNRNFPSKSLNGAYLATDLELDVVLLARRIEPHPSECERFVRDTKIFAEHAMLMTQHLQEFVTKISAKSLAGTSPAFEGVHDGNSLLKL